MRLAFMGTPAFAVPALRALAAAGHEIAAVYTQPPRPADRGKREQASPVQLAADALGLPVRTPASFKPPEVREAWAELGLDAGVVAAYGLILPGAVLDAPRHGCLNIHASLLPRWRGAAPIQRAIIAGDAETGVTIMRMERGLDTGPMYLRGLTQVAGKTAGELTAELGEMGARLMVETLARLTELTPEPQPGDGVTYAAKIDKAEARLDPTRAAVELERAVRAFNPAPGAWVSIRGERLKLLAAGVEDRAGEPGVTIDDALGIACGAGVLRPTLVQRSGGRAMPTAELLRGWPVPAATRIDR
jgi:methionyl-tRNA formyltransferase